MKKLSTYKSALLLLAFIGSSTLFPANVFAKGEKHAKQADGPPVERIAAADPNVAVSLCVQSGDITVRGWNQNQVRARSTNAGEIEFKRPAGAADSVAAREITVLAGKTHGRATCVDNGDIELDVPFGSTVRLTTMNGDISVTEIAKISAVTQSGDVELVGVKSAADATSIGGAIRLRNSSGSAKLRAVGGDIEVSAVGPAVAGDIFDATTVGGEISVRNASYADLRITTVNGALSFNGPLAAGARCQFKTFSGDVSLTLPADSSFRLDARFSRNAELVSDFSLKTSGDTDSAKGSDLIMQRIDGSYGTGNASIVISSFSGQIQLHKK